MIPISQIDPELSIYKENTVVIWGAGMYGREMVKLLQSFQIPVAYFCDSDPAKWKTEIQGIPVILPQHLMKLQLENIAQKSGRGGEIVVQLALRSDYETAVRPQVEDMGIEKVICYEEAWQILRYRQRCQALAENPELESLFEQSSLDSLYLNATANVRRYLLTNRVSPLFVCPMRKAGDVTLMRTLRKHNIQHQQTNSPHLINKKYIPKNTKLILGVREPIIRDISSVFERISSIGDRENFRIYTNDVEFLYQDLIYWSNQTSFALWLDSFAENIVDLLAHPFDQQAGYTTIQEGNFDIFVYQLEKLNDIVPQLSQWVGVPFTELVMGNEAKDKWIAKSYKQAQKELKFSQAYFDACYNDPYIQHFYSQEDIETFKNRWRGHIDPNR